ncbi:FAD dependent oxidoreductase [Crepidotus variabilis]|uniref:FAD dependent oxidoreductase n=1 Tax=Crepidotus variabilis TaxID=179855 RepID=A0A9P6EJP6_9AGAR|nr:FAD dependent oxidoreductase [Crepidotus variabilis]
MLLRFLFVTFLIPLVHSDQRAFVFDEERGLLPSQNPTKSFWLDTPGANPLALEGSDGPLTRDADVCIVGSGMTGVSAAWHLQDLLKDSAAKMKIVILEAREFCSGATGRNGGHLTPNLFSTFRARQALYGTAEALKSSLIETYTSERLVNFIKERNATQKVDLYNGGVVTLVQTADEEAALRKDFASASSAGVDLRHVRWLENKDLVTKYQLDSRLNYTAVKTPAHNLWPCKLVTELFIDAVESSTRSNISITLHTKTQVTSISRLGTSALTCSAYSHQRLPRHTRCNKKSQPGNSQTHDRKWALHTPRGPVTCAYVLHASNAYAGHLLPFFKGRSKLQVSSYNPAVALVNQSSNSLSEAPHDFGIIPTRGQVILVPSKVPLSSFPWLNAWSGGGGHWEYFFPRFQHIASPNDQAPFVVLGGGRQHAGTNFEGGISDDSRINTQVGKALRRFLGTLFDGLFDSGQGSRDLVKMEWTGIMGFTKNGDPYVGPVLRPESSNRDNEFEGQYIAAGYTGHGMVRAYACAEALASMIASKIKQTEWTAPEWLPERYLNWNRHL